MSSGHNKHKGFSQTSKRYAGDLKAQRQQAHNQQLHPKHANSEEEEVNSARESSSASSMKGNKA